MNYCHFYVWFASHQIIYYIMYTAIETEELLLIHRYPMIILCEQSLKRESPLIKKLISNWGYIWIMIAKICVLINIRTQW
jgi:hypothetical protein